MSAQPDATWPTPLKKRCSKCRNWYPATQQFFFRKKERRTRDRSPRYDSWCKRCRLTHRANTPDRYKNESETAKAKRKARLRARQRAWGRLANEFPERMEVLFLEELQREGWDGDEDLRRGSNRSRSSGTYRKVRCRSRVVCGWIGTRKISAGNVTKKPCPWCGGKVEGT